MNKNLRSKILNISDPPERDIHVDTSFDSFYSENINRDRIIRLLSISDPAELSELFAAADMIRQKYVGGEVHLRSLIEISNSCMRMCKYCGLRAANKSLNRYTMSEKEILETVRFEAERGRKTVVLQSGENPVFSAKTVSDIVRKIKEHADIAVTLSLGEYSKEDFKMMREAGADRYLLRHETIDEKLYSELHPGASYENRLKCLEWLSEAGFQVGAGIMVGLPGQTCETIADDILFMKSMKLDMAGIGPFIPHPQTPLKDIPQGELTMALKTIALIRIVMPYILLPATTAIGTIHPHGREKALLCGANVIMPNVTPPELRNLYEIYPGHNIFEGSPDESYDYINRMVASLGRTISKDYGHTYRHRYELLKTDYFKRN
ncbi:MAG TPA: [FeFe] hydrogenase H-cluster radical SAM maturase HydE [bacterium]|nr:[FeFe] hydrogenase H-cluster radical SAM maturase HydE [bacterium]